jgi:acyl-CoA thioesterase I
MSCRIVVLGNSLPIPRPEDGVGYHDTYPYILTSMGFEVINKSKRINDIEIQSIETNLLDDVDAFQPNYLIMHFGIVDCSPRLFTKNNRKLLGILPNIITNNIIIFFSKYRYAITRFRKITYVSIESFEDIFRKIIVRVKKNNKNIKIIVINITQTNEENRRKSYGFSSNISKYNKIFSKLECDFGPYLTLIDSNLYKNGLLKDGIHINTGMNRYLACKISKIINTPKSLLEVKKIQVDY